MFAPLVVGLLLFFVLVKCSTGKKPERSSQRTSTSSAQKSLSPIGPSRSVPNTSRSPGGSTPAVTSDRSGSGAESKPEEPSKDVPPAVDAKLSKTQNATSFSSVLKSPDQTQQATLPPQSMKPKKPSPSRQEKTKDTKMTQATMTVSTEQLRQRTPEAKTLKPVQATCSKEKTKTKNPSKSKERTKTKHQSKSKDVTRTRDQTRDRSKMGSASAKKRSGRRPIETAKEITDHRTSEDDSDTFKNVKSIRDVVKADKERKEKKQQQQE